MKTRSELQFIINDLEASIPQWTEREDDEVDLAMAFADVAGDAFENVSVEDYESLRVRMFDRQAHYGLGGQ